MGNYLRGRLSSQHKRNTESLASRSQAVKKIRALNPDSIVKTTARREPIP
jgi:hypothetical protein